MNNWRRAKEWQDFGHCALETSSQTTAFHRMPRHPAAIQILFPEGSHGEGRLWWPSASQTSPAQLTWPATSTIAHWTRSPPSPLLGSEHIVVSGRGTCSRQDDLHTSQRALFSRDLAALKGLRKCLPPAGTARETVTGQVFFFLPITPWTNPKAAKTCE